ncbi:hypothetical protein LEP1GSC191_2297 [Leptospira borgpetersenii serovar Mini str. 201000851]|uniref:Uncharacterized protein n=3 Tax=Leptospira borgpetersenii TaxID=174 RepID=A0A0E3BBB7_LEPBO|nr:hypothetical protein LBBP_03830 [Leptospira borgpetersenii serovar Ballum]EKP13122.1 hypothetical protein LEP1GSC128_3831 [Leptospira borgpetersenii str. 200801926]EKR00886.1 hypothetical protein LEP1GSC121_0086 [Leptospira borgpetersenii serovar Castellonis str. 200801910]EMN13227.1 hypothetical protein LEP1GSC055_0522 [Leptospira borgpetersenii str. Brem 307]EMN16953.1 hypothetical protein LEP1GSC056_2521 [Leptospira borgpetersenii str. Brem 328]ENO65184.1 hypothetical protein LEP1GSC191_
MPLLEIRIFLFLSNKNFKILYNEKDENKPRSLYLDLAEIYVFFPTTERKYFPFQFIFVV